MKTIRDSHRSHKAPPSGATYKPKKAPVAEHATFSAASRTTAHKMPKGKMR